MKNGQSSQERLGLVLGLFFAVNVLTPLWLQYIMGYNATWAGMVVAWGGVLSVFFAPVVANASERFDARWLVFAGVSAMGLITLWRSGGTTDMSYWQISFLLIFMGIFVPLFFVSVLGVALGSVEEKEMASASGLMNFIRTVAGAFGTSLVATAWQDKTTYAHAELSGIVGTTGDGLQSIIASGMPPGDLGRGLLDGLVSIQSLMLATNELMVVIGVIFIFASFSIWLSPRPARVVDPAAVGH